jgi:hypothetical protein
MKRLAIESWLLLLYIDWIMRFREFRELHRIVGVAQVHSTVSSGLMPNEELCRAMDYACVFYFKRVLCLQRSAATTLLLRRHGWSAEMVIGAQMQPFKSHAWCEIQGAVVNDKPYISDIYGVLERC